MREDVASVVYPVMRQALKYRDRLQRRLPQGIDAAQAELMSLLSLPSLHRQATLDRTPNPHFVMVCWLDELFCMETPAWQDEWETRTFEWEIYNLRDRAHLFWDEVKKAAACSDKDTLEICYLCMLLGFRGELRGDVRRLEDVRAQFEEQIGLRRGSSWPGQPPELALPETDVPPLTARDSLRWLLLALGFIMAAVIFVTSMLVVSQVG